MSDAGDDFDDDFDESFEEAFDEDFEPADSDGGTGIALPSLRGLGESVGEAVLDGIGRASARVQERRPLPADVLESDEAYLVVFDAPGAEREDVQVRFEDNVVAVRIDRFREFQEGFETHVPGRGLSLSGRAALPEGAEVDSDGAEATLTPNGTVRIRVPKRGAGGEGADADEGERDEAATPDEPAIDE